MKNKLLRLKEIVFRVIDTEDEDVLLIDCIKKSMPVWHHNSDADHLYSSMNVIGELLTFLIYVLFIYQMPILAIRRKQAAEISGLS